METRTLGRTGREVGIIGLGCWQLGADWGDVGEDDALAVLAAATSAGVTLLDTADVYGDGRSEQVIARFLRDVPQAERPFVATKVGRRADPFTADEYTAENLRAWVDRSRRHLAVDRLDLVQLHCPPPAVYGDDAVFDVLDELVAEGAIAAYGVSVETREEALRAIARPGVATVQIVLNAFRPAPVAQVLPAAVAAGVGVIARVPLASGLLTGRYDETTTFAADDHRTFNRHGEAFDVGETFSGVPFEVGVEAARRVAAIAGAAHEPVATSAFALRWVLDQPGVTCAIPGARSAQQATGNAAAAHVAPLSADQLAEVAAVYDELVAPSVEGRW